MILQGNSIRIPLADNSVNCVITSPPYWNLRDYNVDGQIGLEPTIAEYITVIVRVFREVKRVLHPTGIAWVNLGDTYATSRNGRSAADTKAVGKDDRTFRDKPFSVGEVPAKNLCLIPQRVALALQDDGWIVRSFIPWIKGNPMPESVEDRPGTAHEYVIMLTKCERYYFDMEGVRRDHKPISIKRWGNGGEDTENNKILPNTSVGNLRNGSNPLSPTGRALRTSDFFNDSLDAYIAHLQSIRDNGGMMLNTEGLPAGLVINSAPYKFAHYATFPTALVRPMILAATSARGCCPKCGKGWVRMTEVIQGGTREVGNKRAVAMGHSPNGMTAMNRAGEAQVTQTTGWRPTCSCNAGEPVPAVILDPFCGSGTVGEVCRELGRRFIGIDLSATYLIENALPRAEMKTSEAAINQLPLFAQAA